MKEISELNLPENARYAENHEWATPDGEEAIIGISDYAQDQLGDIVFVEMPQIGDSFAKGEEFGTVESVKAVAELYLPVGGDGRLREQCVGGIARTGEHESPWGRLDCSHKTG